jgi:hypothetical protein
MPPLHLPRARALRTKALALACLLAASGAVTAGARRWLRPPAPTATPAALPEQEGRIEAEHLTLTPAGFEPVEVTRPQGVFALIVENRAGAEEVELSLEREGGGRINARRERRRRLMWEEELDLPPGRYVLSAGGPAEWQCYVTITPH